MRFFSLTLVPQAGALDSAQPEMGDWMALLPDVEHFRQRWEDHQLSLWIFLSGTAPDALSQLASVRSRVASHAHSLGWLLLPDDDFRPP